MNYSHTHSSILIGLISIAHCRLVEKNTDAFLDNQDKTNKKKQEEVDETVNNCE